MTTPMQPTVTRNVTEREYFTLDLYIDALTEQEVRHIIDGLRMAEQEVIADIVAEDLEEAR